MSHTSSHNPNLYQWKRFSKKKNVQTHKNPNVSDQDIESWINKVEEATERAVQNTFSDKKRFTKYSGSYTHGNDILEIADRVRDDDESHMEAQSLVNDWMNEKLRFNFLDEDEDVSIFVQSDHTDIRESNHLTSGVESAIHEKWYEDSETFINKYLQSDKSNKRSKRKETNDVLGNIDLYDTDESTIVEALMKNMMEKPVIKPSQTRKLRSDVEKKISSRDPRTTMEMRHKEVKEARLRRQKEEGKRREQRLMEKNAKFKAQQILKQEEAEKALLVKKEEEAIQMEMAKLRKEMIEQRKREEKVLKEKENYFKQTLTEGEEQRNKRRQEIEALERKKQKREILNEIFDKERKIKTITEIMTKRSTENKQLLNRCFSSWCKVVLNQRIKLGKAKAMADWKCLQQSWSAWKTYTRSQKLNKETEYHQARLRDEKLKEKRATDCVKLRLQKKYLLAWRVWVKARQERKEILEQQEKTKLKMQALLNAVSSGKLQSSPKDVTKDTQQSVTLQSLDSNDSVLLSQHATEAKPRTFSKGERESVESTKEKRRHGPPKHAWQVTKKDVKRLKPENIRQLNDNIDTERPGKATAVDPYQNRHRVQKEIIDQQRLLLQEQSRMIQDMHEQQKLIALQKEINTLQQEQKILAGQKITNQTTSIVDTSDTQRLQTSARLTGADSKISKSVIKTHPIVSAMEERAQERAKKKKELEEARRKREEERIKRMQEEEDRKQREEEEQKCRELEAKREARRLLKQKEAEKKAQQERTRELTKRADQLHCKHLMKNLGLKPWKRLMDLQMKKYEVAVFHHNRNLQIIFLSAWRTETSRSKLEREKKADDLYHVILLRRGLHSWMKYGERMTILEEKAIIHCNKALKVSYLKQWVNYTTEEKLAQWDKEKRAENHDKQRLLRRAFNVIRSYRILVLREQEKRQRIEEMRRKVNKIIPDFKIRSSVASDVTEDNESSQ